jgi:6-hydroxycyclohex-1-ene-1-carbonyl-CoA dehydrogenase
MSLPKQLVAWQMDAEHRPLVKRALPMPVPGPHEVLIQVAGCGLCHTDLSFLYGGVRTKKALPLTLGHEFSGRVVAAGVSADELLNRDVLVPAVLPCGECELCGAGRATACRQQIMPGNDVDGGFATHAVVPARFVCPVDRRDYELWELGVIADAVTTPYQAAMRAGVRRGDVTVVIGVGGIGSYGVQVCAALGAEVIAVDVDQNKLDHIRSFGARAVVNAKSQESRGVRDAVRQAAKELGVSPHAWKVFEMSGTAPGQNTAYELLTYGGTLGFIGFTMDKCNVRLSNLMAFDATAFGNWGCAPELYAQAVELVVSGKIQIRPFSERHPMDEINAVIDSAHAHRLEKRAVLVP